MHYIGWILLGLIIFAWIMSFIKLYQAVKEMEILEKRENQNEESKEISARAFKFIKQFLFFLIFSTILGLILIAYSLIIS